MKSYFITLFKQFFRSWTGLFVILFPLILLVGLGKLLAAAWIVPSTITIALTTSVLFTFGPNIYELRRTSLIKSMSLTKLNKFTVLSTNILFTLSITAVSWGTTIGVSYLLTEVVPFLATDLTSLDPSLNWIGGQITWAEIEWWTMAVSGLLTIILSFTIVYLFVAFAKTTQGLYLMSFAYILALVVIGGVVIPTFISNGTIIEYFNYAIPHFYTNNLMNTGFRSGFDLAGIDVVALADTLENLMDNSFGTPEMAADMEALNAWVDAGAPFKKSWIGRGSFDWSKVPLYEAGYKFQVSTLGTLITTLWASTIIPGGPSAQQIQVLLSSVLVPLLDQLNPENADSLIGFLVEIFKTSTTLDITSWESSLNLFAPITLILATGSIGMIGFKWSQR